MAEKPDAPSVASLDEARQTAAMRRYEALRPYLDDAVPLSRAAASAGVPLRTAQRWLGSGLVAQPLILIDAEALIIVVARQFISLKWRGTEFASDDHRI